MYILRIHTTSTYYVYISHVHTTYTSHIDLKISSSQAQIDENFANYFLNPIDNNNCFIVLKCTCTEMYMYRNVHVKDYRKVRVRAVKSKPK